MNTTSYTLAWVEKQIAPYLFCLSPETSKASLPLRPWGAISFKATDEIALGFYAPPQAQSLFFIIIHVSFYQDELISLTHGKSPIGHKKDLQEVALADYATARFRVL